MGGELTLQASGDGGGDHGGAVPVARVILQNQHGPNAALLRTYHRAEVGVVNVAAADGFAFQSQMRTSFDFFVLTKKRNHSYLRNTG
jgi:hypothetical protein